MLMMGTLYKFDTNTRNKYQYICSVSDSDKDIDKLKALRVSDYYKNVFLI